MFGLFVETEAGKELTITPFFPFTFKISTATNNNIPTLGRLKRN